ncbi:hypothetical protein [Pantanalinema sp. GBBB05]|uniref:hypothetical protein n=1 Tax=Pantanalinema sp. GBBB05 TaxID=2604139 RepID=UPI001D28D12B|nr:hypothetical protein [Pantanalinema sp. GBBB05]
MTQSPLQFFDSETGNAIVSIGNFDVHLQLTTNLNNEPGIYVDVHAINCLEESNLGGLFVSNGQSIALLEAKAGATQFLHQSLMEQPHDW